MRRRGILQEAAQRFYIYFLTDSNRHIIQVNLSTDLIRSLQAHKNSPDLFMGPVQVHRLVYFEELATREQALSRIRQLQQWTRPQKEKLIRAANPDWVDISVGLGFEHILDRSFGTKKSLSMASTHH